MWPTTRHSLLCGALAGEDGAWQEFVTLYRPAVLRCLRGRRIPPADAEDICQELLVKLYRKLDTYDRECGRFRPWLRAVLARVVCDFSRAHGKRAGEVAWGGDDGIQRMAALAAPEGLDALVATLDPDPESTAAAVMEELRRWFSQADLDAYLAVVGYGQSSREAAARLGRTARAVSASTYRVRKRLAAIRADRPPTDTPAEL